MYPMPIRQLDLCLRRTQEVARQSISERVSHLVFARCHHGTDRTPYSYVEMLEQNHAQLVNGIQELYARAVSGQAWVGPPLKTQSNGHPHIHDILERLGALKGDSRSGSEAFEEDLHVLQQNLFASGAGLMHPHDSVDNSDTEQTRPAFSGVETMPARPFFTAPFGPSSGLPTPPMQTPSGRLSLQIPAEAQFRQQPSYECQSRGSCPQANMNPTGLHRQSWPRPVPTEESLEFLRYAMPAYDNARPQQISQTPADLRALSPMAVPVDWIEDDFSTYLQPSLS